MTPERLRSERQGDAEQSLFAIGKGASGLGGAGFHPAVAT